MIKKLDKLASTATRERKTDQGDKLKAKALKWPIFNSKFFIFKIFLSEINIFVKKYVKITDPMPAKEETSLTE